MESKELFNSVVSEDQYTNAGKVFLNVIKKIGLGYRELHLVSKWIQDYLILFPEDKNELSSQLETHYSL